jgi:hypothetical protein
MFKSVIKEADPESDGRLMPHHLRGVQHTYRCVLSPAQGVLVLFEDTTFGESKLYLSRVHQSSPSVKSISQIHQGKNKSSSGSAEKKKLKRECKQKTSSRGSAKKAQGRV